MFKDGDLTQTPGHLAKPLHAALPPNFPPLLGVLSYCIAEEPPAIPKSLVKIKLRAA